MPTGWTWDALVAEVAAADEGREPVSVQVQVHVPDVPVEVAGDQAALERTMRNLLDNARRHAASRVEVSVCSRGDSRS